MPPLNELDLDRDPALREFVLREFADAPIDLGDDGVSRRRFMQLMGASLALAGVGGCRREQSLIMPESRRPHGHVPGELSHFATVMELGGAPIGLVATSFEGRPIKLDGNPNHPASLGGTSPIVQASLLELYDPDRSRAIVRRQGTSTSSASWDELNAFLRARTAELRKGEGAGLAVLSEASSSQTLAALRARLLALLPKARWYEYEGLSRDNEREGTRLALGAPYGVRYAVARAQVVACLDDDLFAEHPEALRLAREYATARDPNAEWMGRWYAVEAQLSLTGVNADHRLPLAASHVRAFVLALLAEVQRALGQEPTSPPPSEGVLADERTRAFVRALAADLAQHRGASLVTTGPRQSRETHALVLRLNALLGNLGATVLFFPDHAPERPSHQGAIKALVGELNAGRVETLVVLGGNPVYDGPAELAVGSAFAKARESLHLSLYDDETSRRCTWHLPRAHFLESFGDARAVDGTLAIAQPLIAPLYGGKSPLELVSMLLGDVAVEARELVREPFSRFDDGEARWRAALKSGVVEGSAALAESPRLAAFEVAPLSADELRPLEARGELEVSFVPDRRLYDGRFANLGWLQELPDPISKLTWDNALLVGPSTAERLRLSNEQVVRLEVAGRSLEVPVLISPGQAPGTAALAVGGGRTAAGHVGGLTGEAPSVGVDAYRLRTSASLGFARGVAVTPTLERSRLATTQDHYPVDAVGERGTSTRLEELVREATLVTYRQRPDFARHTVHVPPLASLWRDFEYHGHRWAMAIDLNTCIGCGACVVACQAENNVPVVGKEQVAKNREMHWLRVDRYFAGDAENPAVKKQPVTCQHCEMAPCESVCPVNASVHSAEGLNAQVYNRCVGTRYCANNCPYKVRRFNYFNYQKHLDEPRREVLKLLHNPDVTVRSRGVMEKCTFCTQRIERVKIAARNDNRPVADGEIMPACAEACPTRAIRFGDLNDADSVVARAHADPRAYGLLAELNTRPRNAYLARITNPNPLLQV